MSPETHYVSRVDQSYHVQVEYGNATLHLLRGSCSGTVVDSNDDEQCSQHANYRYIHDDDTLTDRCFWHMPDEWPEPTLTGDDRTPVYKLTQECIGQIRRTYRSNDNPYWDDPLEETDTEDNSPADRITQCDDRAFILVINGVGDRLPYCRRHARDAWLDQLRAPEEQAGLAD